MKNIFFLSLLTILFVTGCSKKTEPPSLTNIITSKQWKVSYVRNYNADFTPLYTDIKFAFAANGKVAVLYGTITYNGTWSENTSTGNLFIDIESPFFELDFISREWQVMNTTFTGINLTNDKTYVSQEVRFAAS